MKTYQDLTAVGQDEKARIAFIRSAIEDHRGSAAYQTALDAEFYYDGENPTTNRYEKILYDIEWLLTSGILRIRRTTR